MLVPCSHSVLAAGHDTSTTYPLWTLDEETMTKLVADGGGIVAPSGKPGGLLMFHGKTPGLRDPLSLASPALALAVSALVAFPVNPWLIAGGHGHAVVHAHPYLGFEETRTAGPIARLLHEFRRDEVALGPARTGVAGVIRGRGGGGSTGPRADIDAPRCAGLRGVAGNRCAPPRPARPARRHGSGVGRQTTTSTAPSAPAISRIGLRRIAWAKLAKSSATDKKASVPPITQAR